MNKYIGGIYIKKLLIIILASIFFLIGIRLGGKYTISQSNLFEASKDEFETQIVIPNNQYETKTLAPTPGVANKVAQKIDGIITTLIDKIINQIR